MPPDPEHDPDTGRELFDDALIRTHLANERTFLAWLRTAVVLLGVGLGAIALAVPVTSRRPWRSPSAASASRRR